MKNKWGGNIFCRILLTLCLAAVMTTPLGLSYAADTGQPAAESEAIQEPAAEAAEGDLPENPAGEIPGGITAEEPETSKPTEIAAKTRDKARSGEAETAPELKLLEIEELTETPKEGVPYDGYIVKIKESEMDVRMLEAAQAAPFAGSLFVVENPEDVLQFADPEQIEYIEPNLQLSMLSFPQTIPNDPDWAEKQWNLNGSYGINVQGAWNRGFNGSGVTIAVVDSGVNAMHQDFLSNGAILQGYNFTGKNGKEVAGGEVSDASGHGTIVTSLIAAGTNNGKNISGIAYGAKIIPIKIFYPVSGASYSASISDFLGALEKIDTIGNVDVVNLSLGIKASEMNPGTRTTMQTWINKLTAQGVIIVTAVGNDGGTEFWYPAACDNVIGVGSIDSTGRRSDFSQYNSTVDITAPGQDIYGLDKTGTTLTTASGGDGTSYAAPQVAAIAALAKGYRHSVTAGAVLQLLSATATDRGSAGRDDEYGAGILNAAQFAESFAALPYTVTFHSNGGSSVTSQNAGAGTAIGALPSSTRVGFLLDGWYTAPDGGTRITEATLVTSDVTYYAHWTTPVEAFVERLYVNVLGRDSEAAGKAQHVNALNAGSTDGARTALGFFFSDEMIQRGLSDDEWVEICYRTFLNRPSDSEGKQTWLAQLAAGLSRYFVFSGFVGSHEFSEICSSYGIMRGTYVSSEARDQNPNITAFVYRLYSECLGRTPDVVGLNNWCESLISGQSNGADTAYGFFFSSEITQRGLRDEDWIDACYRTFLNRPADSEGKAAWLGQLSSGVSREGVFAGFVGSAEFASICSNYGIVRGTFAAKEPRDQNPRITAFVFRLYTECLGRTPDIEGLNNWCAILVTGQSSGADIARGFFYSPEFSSKFTTPQEIVTAAYKALLGRDPDTEGLDYWVDKMVLQGYTKENIFSGFAMSPEFEALCNSYGIRRGIVDIPVGMISSEPMKGIDVSYWNGGGNNTAKPAINWAAVKSSGVRFVIARAGWIDEHGNFEVDSTYALNVRNARANGIVAGAYIYLYSYDFAQQSNGINTFNNYTRANGLTLDLPVFLDVEDKAFEQGTNARGGTGFRTELIRSGMIQLRALGYKPGFYTSLAWANNKLDAKQLFNEGNSFWLASWYDDKTELSANTPSWNGNYPSVWQYRSTGTVPGINGNVDMNWLYPGIVEWT